MSDSLRPSLIISDLLSSALMPTTDTWEGARCLTIWEQHALCYLDRTRDGPICAWTARLRDVGYPPKGSLKGRYFQPGDEPWPGEGPLPLHDQLSER